MIKIIRQVLRTNRTLKSLSLARNLIKDEGAFALVSVLSTFQLNDYETNWKSKQEQQRNRLLEYLVSFNSLYSGNSPKNFLLITYFLEP